MSDADTTPDPVRETAPEAPPAPDDPATDDTDTPGGAVFPIAGPGAGTVPVPPTPGRAG